MTCLAMMTMMPMMIYSVILPEMKRTITIFFFDDDDDDDDHVDNDFIRGEYFVFQMVLKLLT